MGARIDQVCLNFAEENVAAKRSEFGGAVAHMRKTSGKAVDSEYAPLELLHHLLEASFWAPSHQRCGEEGTGAVGYRS